MKTDKLRSRKVAANAARRNFLKAIAGATVLAAIPIEKPAGTASSETPTSVAVSHRGGDLGRATGPRQNKRLIMLAAPRNWTGDQVKEFEKALNQEAEMRYDIEFLIVPHGTTVLDPKPIADAIIRELNARALT